MGVPTTVVFPGNVLAAIRGKRQAPLTTHGESSESVDAPHFNAGSLTARQARNSFRPSPGRVRFPLIKTVLDLGPPESHAYR